MSESLLARAREIADKLYDDFNENKIKYVVDFIEAIAQSLISFSGEAKNKIIELEYIIESRAVLENEAYQKGFADAKADTSELQGYESKSQMKRVEALKKADTSEERSYISCDPREALKENADVINKMIRPGNVPYSVQKDEKCTLECTNEISFPDKGTFHDATDCICPSCIYTRGFNAALKETKIMNGIE